MFPDLSMQSRCRSHTNGYPWTTKAVCLHKEARREAEGGSGRLKHEVMSNTLAIVNGCAQRDPIQY